MMSQESVSVCLLCPTDELDSIKSNIKCFSPVVSFSAGVTKTTSTVADILNQHFWFELQSDRDAATFVCHSCWLQVEMFNAFYRSVLKLYESRRWPPDVVHSTCTTKPSLDLVPDHLDLNGSQCTLQQETIIPNDDYEVGTSQADFEAPYGTELLDENVEYLDISRSPSVEDLPDNYQQLPDEIAQITQLPDESVACLASRQASNSNDESLTARAAIKKRRIQNEDLLLRYMQMQCDECGEPYDSFAAGKEHQLMVHGRQPGYVMCCDRKFASKAGALRHCKWHEDPHQLDCTNGEQRFECFECHRRFDFSSALRQHMRKHDPEPSFVCHVCAQTFRTKDAYELHVAKHDGLLLKRQCPQCGRWYEHEGTLKWHIRNMHNGRPPPPCEICGHQAPNEYALKSHMHQRHRPKPHHCTLCDRTFRDKQRLREHMALHTGMTELYQCAYCPKTCRSDRNMAAHRKRKHAEQYAADRMQKAIEEDERNRASLAEATEMHI